MTPRASCPRPHRPALPPRVIPVLLAVLVLVLVPASGCLETSEPDELDVQVTTTHDPAMTREDHRDQVPAEGASASHGRLNVFLFTPEGFDQMDGEWGLWDPVVPPERSPGETIAFPGNHSARFPLDPEGHVEFGVDAPSGTVIAFWVWGSTDAGGEAGCPARFFYTSPDAPAATLIVGEDAEADVEVPFGMGCTA